jgi:hypothetical protein
MTPTKQWQRILARMATAGLLGGLLTAAPTTKASQATEVELDDIPTRLVWPTDPAQYPDPICLGCKVVAKRSSAASEGDDAGGVLQVSYDEVSTFVGDIVITVFVFDTREHHVVTLDGVVLTHGQTVELPVPPGTGWSWDDVESVWVELVPRL